MKSVVEDLISQDRKVNAGCKDGIDQEIFAQAESNLAKLRHTSTYSPWNDTFLHSSRGLQQDLLFQSLRKMPKGALLHTHSLAATEFNTIFTALSQDPLARVYLGHKAELVKELLPESARSDVLHGTLGYKVDGKCEDEPWKPLSAVEESELEKYFVVEESLDRQHRWSMFNEMWMRVRNVAHSLNLILGGEDPQSGLLWKILKDQLDSGVTFFFWKKIVSTPYFRIVDGHEVDVPVEGFVEDFGRVVDQFKKEYPSFHGAKLVFCCLKFESAEQVGSWASRVAAMQKNSPDYVDGFDLVGHEDSLTPLSVYTESIAAVKAKAKQEGDDLILALHAGESSDPNNPMCYDAVALECARIGHGFALAFHPHLMEVCKSRGTVIECCPISNQVLGYVPDIRIHPARTLFRHGLKVAISPDDPGMFGYGDVTYDWTAVTVAWGLNLSDLWSLAENSIDALDASVRELARDPFRENWKKWILELSKIEF